MTNQYTYGDIGRGLLGFGWRYESDRDMVERTTQDQRLHGLLAAILEAVQKSKPQEDASDGMRDALRILAGHETVSERLRRIPFNGSGWIPLMGIGSLLVKDLNHEMLQDFNGIGRVIAAKIMKWATQEEATL